MRVVNVFYKKDILWCCSTSAISILQRIIKVFKPSLNYVFWHNKYVRAMAERPRDQHVSELSKADVHVSQFRLQIVPDFRSGNRKGSVAETVLCPWNDACSVLDDRSRRRPLSASSWTSSTRYWGPDQQIVTCAWYRPVWTALVCRSHAAPALIVSMTCLFAAVQCRLYSIAECFIQFWFPEDNQIFADETQLAQYVWHELCHLMYAVDQGCSPRDLCLGLESTRDHFYAVLVFRGKVLVLVLVLILMVSVMVSVLKDLFSDIFKTSTLSDYLFFFCYFKFSIKSDSYGNRSLYILVW